MKTYNDDNRLKISFKLNDELLQKQVKPRQLLSDFLRFDCGMTGTHVGGKGNGWRRATRGSR